MSCIQRHWLFIIQVISFRDLLPDTVYKLTLTPMIRHVYSESIRRGIPYTRKVFLSDWSRVSCKEVFRARLYRWWQENIICNYCIFPNTGGVSFLPKKFQVDFVHSHILYESRALEGEICIFGSKICWNYHGDTKNRVRSFLVNKDRCLPFPSKDEYGCRIQEQTVHATAVRIDTISPRRDLSIGICVSQIETVSGFLPGLEYQVKLFQRDRSSIDFRANDNINYEQITNFRTLECSSDCSGML